MNRQKRLERLSPRLRELYRALQELETQFKAPPTVREIVEHLELTDDEISRVHGDMLKLVEMNLIAELNIPTRKYTARGYPPADEIDWEAMIQ